MAHKAGFKPLDRVISLHDDGYITNNTVCVYNKEDDTVFLAGWMGPVGPLPAANFFHDTIGERERLQFAVDPDRHDLD